MEAQDTFLKGYKQREIILVQKHRLAAAIAMAQDVLAVDRYVSQKIGITPFDPSQLCFKEVGDNKFWMNPHARVVAQAGPILEKIGIEARRVGSSCLYKLKS